MPTGPRPPGVVAVYNRRESAKQYPLSQLNAMRHCIGRISFRQLTRTRWRQEAPEEAPVPPYMKTSPKIKMRLVANGRQSCNPSRIADQTQKAL